MYGELGGFIVKHFTLIQPWPRSVRMCSRGCWSDVNIHRQVSDRFAVNRNVYFVVSWFIYFVCYIICTITVVVYLNNTLVIKT